MWQIARQRVEHRDRLLTVLNPDVHVQTEDHQTAGRPLTAVHEHLIPILGCDLLLGPFRKGMRASRDELVAEVIANGKQLPDPRRELAANLRDVLTYVGVELDRRLDKLGFDVLLVV